jgi:hypothetical protein
VVDGAQGIMTDAKRAARADPRVKTPSWPSHRAATSQVYAR